MTEKTAASAARIPSFWETRSLWFVMIACAVVLAIFAGLLPYGHWQPDEYEVAVAYRAHGPGYVWQRILSWSPRPLSEGLIAGYLQAVAALNRPLIAPVLAMAWAMVFVVALWPATWKKGDALGTRSWPEGATPYWVLLVLFFLGHPVAELFYWPMASLAYLPTLAALVLLCRLNEEASSGTIVFAKVIALTAAAASTEVGAMFVVCHAVIGGVLLPWDRHAKRGVTLLAMVVPLAMAAWVLYRLMNGRVAAAGETFGDARYVHAAVPSIVAAIPHTLWEWLGADGMSIDTRHLLLGVVMKAGFLLGCCALIAYRGWRSVAWREQAALTLGCFAMVPVTLAAAYYQFGMMACCERHSAFRQCLVLVGIASMAPLLAMFTPIRRRLSTLRYPVGLAAGSFTVALLAGSALAQKSLRADYAARESLEVAQHSVWNQGGRPDGSAEAVSQARPGRVVGGYPVIPAGSYSLDAHTRPDVAALLRFFDRQDMVFLAPGKDPGRSLPSTDVK